MSDAGIVKFAKLDSYEGAEKPKDMECGPSSNHMSYSEERNRRVFEGVEQVL